MVFILKFVMSLEMLNVKAGIFMWKQTNCILYKICESVIL